MYRYCPTGVALPHFRSRMRTSELEPPAKIRCSSSTHPRGPQPDTPVGVPAPLLIVKIQIGPVVAVALPPPQAANVPLGESALQSLWDRLSVFVPTLQEDA